MHCAQVPHYVPWINCLRGGLNAVLAWVSLMCVVLTYTVHWEWDDKNHPHWDEYEYRELMTTVRLRVCCAPACAACCVPAVPKCGV